MSYIILTTNWVKLNELTCSLKLNHSSYKCISTFFVGLKRWYFGNKLCANHPN